MIPIEGPAQSGCPGCPSSPQQGFDFTMAFQPIVDVLKRDVFAYEALVRGLNGETAHEVLQNVDNENRYWFDQECRRKAITVAARLGVGTVLSINFMPNAVYRAESCIRATLAVCTELRFPTNRIMFEVTESEQVRDSAHLQAIFKEYRRLGFLTAIDDFGSGFSDLKLLADFQPDMIKLDLALTRGIDSSRPRRSIVTALLGACRELDISVVAEGVETLDEYRTLLDLGVTLQQGYLFAKPVFEALPAPVLPGMAATERRAAVESAAPQ